MNAVTQPAFAHRLAQIADTFEAWRVSGTDTALPLDVTATTLDEALNTVLANHFLTHKDTLLLRHTHGPSGKAVLHVYRIRQESKPVYRRNPSTGLSEPTRRMYPEPQFALAVAAFEPVLPFRWAPGCDVVGRQDGGVING